MNNTVLSLLSCHRHEKDTDKGEKYCLQRLAVRKNGFASERSRILEAKTLEYDRKIVERVYQESGNSWAAFMGQLEFNSP